ncbi:hypothetical protein [Deinococcus malanensis]|uniref:hypothetical protein n=1 Tax=Deinococcus malanensis TaxID=1706855 RepID=UPI0016688589|nr:hypothetical protein [Deinococcus malanensis]
MPNLVLDVTGGGGTFWGFESERLYRDAVMGGSHHANHLLTHTIVGENIIVSRVDSHADP